MGQGQSLSSRDAADCRDGCGGARSLVRGEGTESDGGGERATRRHGCSWSRRAPARGPRLECPPRAAVSPRGCRRGGGCRGAASAAAFTRGRDRDFPGAWRRGGGRRAAPPIAARKRRTRRSRNGSNAARYARRLARSPPASMAAVAVLGRRCARNGHDGPKTATRSPGPGRARARGGGTLSCGRSGKCILVWRPLGKVHTRQDGRSD